MNIKNYMKCIHCYRELLELYYIFDRNSNKHLIGRCSCRKGSIFMPRQDNLAIPIKLSKKQLKDERKRMQSSLF